MRTASERLGAGEADAAPARLYYGWWIVAVAFVCHAVNTGLIFYAWSAFLTPLAAEFGGRAPVAAGYTLLQIAAATYGFAVGRIVDRRGARLVQATGGAALAVGFVLVSRAHSLPALYCCLAGPVALGSTCIGGLPNNAAVARWFVRRRGRALGASTAGISAGGIVFAPLAQHLIVTVGWRAAYAILGGVVAVLVVPSALVLMRRDPADLGLLPDGEPPLPSAREPALALYARELERSVRPDVAVRHANFWLIAASFSLTMAGLSTVLLYQIPLLIDRGMPAGRVARPRRDRGHGRGRKARVRRAARSLRPAARRRGLLRPAGGRRPPPLVGPDPQRRAPRLLRRPLRLRDGRERDAPGEPAR